MKKQPRKHPPPTQKIERLRFYKSHMYRKKGEILPKKVVGRAL